MKEHCSTNFDAEALLQRAEADPDVSHEVLEAIREAIFDVRNQLQKLDDGIPCDVFTQEELEQAFREYRSGPEWEKLHAITQEWRRKYMPPAYQKKDGAHGPDVHSPPLTHTARLAV